MADVKSDTSSPIAEDLLTHFLAALAELPKPIIAALLKLAETDDHKAIIASHGRTVADHFSQLASFLRAQSANISPQRRLDAEQVLRLSSASNLTASVTDLSGFLYLDLAKIGTSDIVHEIKKIVDALVSALGFALPSWFESILLVIDELFNNGLLGGQSVNLRDTLSRSEQNFLIERTLAMKHQREQALFAQDTGASVGNPASPASNRPV
jgi:hypothetical protein